jgi:hypothetical protein
MRKIQTMSNDMGVTRHTALRWLAILRNADYIKTVNTGRSLTIQIMRWNPIAGVGKTQLQKSAISDFRYEQYPTSRQTHVRPIPPQIGAISGFAAATNETKIQINVINDPRGGISQKPMNNGLTSIGDSIRRELLAQELAKGLNDQAGISLYRSYSVNYPEWLLRKVLAEVRALPPERISKSRGALFNYLVQYHAKGVTKNPRD